MESEYPIEQLGNYVKVQGGYAYKSRDWQSSGTPVLKIKNVRAGSVDTSEPAYVSAEVAEETNRYFIKHGDILISMTGSGPNQPNSVVGRVARFIGQDNTFLLNQRVGRFVIEDQEQLDPRFLYFVLSAEEHQKELVLSATGSANQANISGDQIGRLDVPIPPIGEQRAIASILGALDDKIELNRRMNATLESMARALFKSWFVDFDPVKINAGKMPAGSYDREVLELFPSGFQDSELGLIPEGWEVKSTSDMFEVKDGTHASPKRTEAGFPLVTSKHIIGDRVDIENAYLISEEDFEEVNRRSKVDRLDTLITMIGTVGESLLVHIREPDFAIKNIGLFKTSQAPELAYFFFLYISSPKMRQFLASRMGGTTQSYLTLKTLRSVPVLVPSGKVIEEFNRACITIFDQIACNTRETATLNAKRDALLPQLLSGELPVAVTLTLIEEVA